MRTLMKHQVVLVLWALGTAAACGSVSNPNTDANTGGGSDGEVAAGDFAIAVDQTSVSLPISGKVDIAVTITRSELADAIDLTATGLPTGATATFAATSLPDGTDSTMMTLTVDTTADAGTTDITVTGKAGDVEHSATVSLELHTQTVTGKVRYDLQDVTVRIVGQSAVQSDAMGNFTFTDVKVPYDIYVVGTTGLDNNPIPAVSYYKALTRLDPVVTRPSPACSLCLSLVSKSATVTGSRFGTGNNTDPIYAAWSSGGSGVRTDGTWYFTASWFGFNQNTVSGTLHVLQPTLGTLNTPTGFQYGASPSVTLTAGGTTNINVTLAALATTASLTGTVTQPAGFSTPTVTLTQTLIGKQIEIWNATTTNATSKIPTLTDQKASFYARSTNASRVSEAVFPNLTASTDVSMTLPPPAGMTGPVNGATNVTTSTPFEFTTSANQVYLASFNSSTATFFVYTSSGSITIPELPEMALPSATSYTWTVTGFGPNATIDDAADMAPLRYVFKYEADGTWHSLTTNPTRSFTTQ